jgi:hypothetical protein
VAALALAIDDELKEKITESLEETKQKRSEYGIT